MTITTILPFCVLFIKFEFHPVLVRKNVKLWLQVTACDLLLLSALFLGTYFFCYSQKPQMFVAPLFLKSTSTIYFLFTLIYFLLIIFIISRQALTSHKSIILSNFCFFFKNAHNPPPPPIYSKTVWDINSSAVLPLLSGDIS